METTFIPVIVVASMAVPVLIVWLITRVAINKTNQRAAVMLAAIEKNGDIDLEELFKMMNPKRTTLKERVMKKLVAGCIFTFIGVAFLALDILVFFYGVSRQSMGLFSFLFVVFTGIGISFFISYAISRRYLAREIEEEEKKQEGKKR